MALAQRQSLTADLGAVRRAAHAARRALIAALGVIGIASSASALVITGGPTYSLPVVGPAW
jgi:hypothetical protein